MVLITVLGSSERGGAGVLDETLTALAAAGGGAVVQAAGTSLWTAFSNGVARLFGRGDERSAQVTLVRLDRTAAALGQVAADDAERVRRGEESSWQTRFQDLLDELPEREREEAATDLRGLVELVSRQGSVTTGDGGLAVGGNVSIRADHGSAAAGVINGGVHLGTPYQPGPAQG